MSAFGERSFMRLFFRLASILTGLWASSGLEMDPDGLNYRPGTDPKVDSGLEMDPNG